MNIKYFIPGILLAATGVGAGDLMTGSLAGVHVGLAVVFAPLLGGFLKYFLNLGLAQYQLATDQTLLEGWLEKFGKVFHFVFLVYLVVWSYSVGGALINGAGVAMDSILPLGDYETSKMLWGATQSILTLILVLKFDFDKFSKFLSILVGVMFIGVIATAILLFPGLDAWTDSFSSFSLGGSQMNWIVGSIGGVGGTLTILSYGYWIREEKRKGESGLSTCKTDLLLAYTMTAIFSVAMIIIGSKLPASEAERSKLALILSNQVGLELGVVGKWIFLVGFWGGVYSSMVGVFQSVPYLFADYMKQMKGASKENLTSSKEYKTYLYLLAIVPMSALFIKLESIQLFYAIFGACFMPFLAISLLVLGNSSQMKTFKFSKAINFFLILTLVFFAYVGIDKIVDKLG